MRAEVSATGSRPGTFRRLVAVGLGTGYLPVAPGTFGSIPGLLLAWVLWALGGWPAVLAGTLAVLILGTWAAHGVARSTGRTDPSEVVVDEVAGQMLALWFVTPAPFTLALSFLLFRFFDILKPPPARQSEALPGGFGIMMDDVIAAVYANLTLQGLALLFPELMGAA